MRQIYKFVTASLLFVFVSSCQTSAPGGHAATPVVSAVTAPAPDPRSEVQKLLDEKKEAILDKIISLCADSTPKRDDRTHPCYMYLESWWSVEKPSSYIRGQDKPLFSQARFSNFIVFPEGVLARKNEKMFAARLKACKAGVGRACHVISDECKSPARPAGLDASTCRIIEENAKLAIVQSEDKPTLLQTQRIVNCREGDVDGCYEFLDSPLTHTISDRLKEEVKTKLEASCKGEGINAVKACFYHALAFAQQSVTNHPYFEQGSKKLHPLCAGKGSGECKEAHRIEERIIRGRVNEEFFQHPPRAWTGGTELLAQHSRRGMSEYYRANCKKRHLFACASLSQTNDENKKDTDDELVIQNFKQVCEDSRADVQSQLMACVALYDLQPDFTAAQTIGTACDEGNLDACAVVYGLFTEPYKINPLKKLLDACLTQGDSYRCLTIFSPNPIRFSHWLREWTQYQDLNMNPAENPVKP